MIDGARRTGSYIERSVVKGDPQICPQDIIIATSVVLARALSAATRHRARGRLAATAPQPLDRLPRGISQAASFGAELLRLPKQVVWNQGLQILRSVMRIYGCSNTASGDSMIMAIHKMTIMLGVCVFMRSHSDAEHKCIVLYRRTCHRLDLYR